MEGDSVPPASSTPPRVPTWVKVLGIIGLLVLLVVVLVLIFAPEGHGPGRHGGGSSSSGNQTTSTSHTAPSTHHSEQDDTRASLVLALNPHRRS